VVTTSGTGLAGVTVSATSPGSGTVTQSAAPAAAIPDNGPVVESAVTVSGSGNVTGVKVSVNVTHTYRGDVELTLVHPDGTLVRLKAYGSADAAANLVTTYPDQTQPLESLAALNGKPIAGAWKLRVRDAGEYDTGTFNNWSVTVTGAGTTKTATSGTDGSYSITALPAGTYTVTVSETDYTIGSRSVTVGPSQTGVDLTATGSSTSYSVSGTVTPKR
jgi:subtilisin-like proprotein convertase family protein